MNSGAAIAIAFHRKLGGKGLQPLCGGLEHIGFIGVIGAAEGAEANFCSAVGHFAKALLREIYLVFPSDLPIIQIGSLSYVTLLYLSVTWLRSGFSASLPLMRFPALPLEFRMEGWRW